MPLVYQITFPYRICRGKPRGISPSKIQAAPITFPCLNETVHPTSAAPASGFSTLSNVHLYAMMCIGGLLITGSCILLLKMLWTKKPHKRYKHLPIVSEKEKQELDKAHITILSEEEKQEYNKNQEHPPAGAILQNPNTKELYVRCKSENNPKPGDEIIKNMIVDDLASEDDAGVHPNDNCVTYRKLKRIRRE